MEVSNVSLIVGLIVVLVSISWFFLKKYSKHSNVQEGVVVLHQFGRWEFTPSQSPFCFKLETFFRIARIPYINEYGIKMSNKGKLPFIEVDGNQYCDSHLIIQMFKQKYHIDLDSHLTIQQHAILYSFQRLLEDHLNFGVLHLRWTDNFPEVRKYSLKLPFLIDLLFAPMIQSQMVKQSVAQGIGKHSNDEIEEQPRRQTKRKKMASQRLEVGRKIIAIGRNFSEHAKELGNQPPSELFFFLKPTSSIIRNGEAIEIPPGAEVHHEVELGVLIGKKGRDIRIEDSMSYVAAYFLALDMTNRTLQNIVKQKGLPWSAAKGFDTSCPISDFIPKEKIPDPNNVDLWLKVNGQLKQKGNTSGMTFKVDSIISQVSKIMTLEPGDLILTGTPSGVGPVKDGDIITSGIQNVIEMKNLVVKRKSNL